jgi:opacity protein-like surface antigen
MNRPTILVLGLAALIVAASSAPAQSAGQKPPAKPAQPAAPAKPAPAKPAKPSDQQTLAIRGIVSVGLTSLSSSQSFDAVAGTHSKTTFGFGAEIQNIWKNVFAGVAYSPMSLEGERVFIDSNVVYKLGVPVDISVNSLDIVGGWRFVLKPKGNKPAPPKPGQKPPKEPLASLATFAQAKGQPPPQKPAQPAASAAKGPQPASKPPRLVPFVGGGLSMVSYKETSANSNGEDVSDSATGFVFLGGVDYTLTKWIQVGGEFRYRAVTGILGSAGVSDLYGEDSVGGWAVGVRVSVGKSFGK